MTERLFLRLDGDPLYAPETTVPAGAMDEFAVSAPLQDCIASVVSYREVVPDGREWTERVLPDGAVHLVFNLGEAPSAGEGIRGLAVEAVGATARPAVLRLRGRVEGLSVTLLPGAVEAVLGVPAKEVADQAVCLDEFWRGEAGHLLEQMAGARSDAARVRRLEAVLQRRLAGRDRAAMAQARYAAGLAAQWQGRRPLREIADAVGVGERRLQQIFQTHVGLSPRTWARLARMHACLRALRGPAPPRWSQLALEAGFYDQSHLVNEFQALCGLSPSLFLERAVSGSSKTAD
ncbi:helix-turn-helix domain-containing protein [Aquabacterium sp. A7-Y]|uniref:helix-turn-helix domain-containing protein n=1 Tax=Aquabacterium sp. A7-Y TaxID=1349605 RepID=UPI00223D652B|nr:helix-turn-helix domain-containing protein [Aquabacterium sp. A7-Y]MCW7541864.1 helix-turn-helix domain-containing protein [Aquabacterium sp. A7-Y]